MRRVARMVWSGGFLLLLCIGAGSQARVEAAVFRDRAAFSAAAQNLHTVDFENQTSLSREKDTVDGIVFESLFGPLRVAAGVGAQGKVLRAGGVGEITQLLVRLPPGTTAVGCEQFTRSMDVTTSNGETVNIGATDATPFVGFVTDTPVEYLIFRVDFPEPTDDVVIDDLTFGQRRAGNDPPAPLLLFNAATTRAAALDSVTATAEPFNVASTHNLSADGRTRITLFLVGVRLDAPGDAAFVTARAEDAQHRVFDLPVEAAAGVKNLSWMAQVTVRLPDDINGAGDLTITITVRGAHSNNATLHVN
ncbi:MAG: hypothetical protein QOJ76_945 [Acidobacteriota bacterium]|nr:hypothetical protein [Acidobacteriota bacterium]